jgi:hypothetical protein
VTQEWYFINIELALAELGIQLVLMQSLKHDMKMFFIFFHTLLVYQNIINEDHGKLIQLRNEN